VVWRYLRACERYSPIPFDQRVCRETEVIPALGCSGVLKSLVKATSFLRTDEIYWASVRRASAPPSHFRTAKENLAARGFPNLAAFTSGKRGAARKALAGTSSGGQSNPNCAGSPAMRTAMPARPAAARDLGDIAMAAEMEGATPGPPRRRRKPRRTSSRRYGK
jgi:hypothetical protein